MTCPCCITDCSQCCTNARRPPEPGAKSFIEILLDLSITRLCKGQPISTIAVNQTVVAERASSIFQIGDDARNTTCAFSEFVALSSAQTAAGLCQLTITVPYLLGRPRCVANARVNGVVITEDLADPECVSSGIFGACSIFSSTPRGVPFAAQAGSTNDNPEGLAYFFSADGCMDGLSFAINSTSQWNDISVTVQGTLTVVENPLP